MGYNTVAVILNDALIGLERDPNVGKGIADGVRNWYGRHRDQSLLDVPAGGHCVAVRIISQDHADGEQVTIVHGNAGWTADEAQPGTLRALSWRGLNQMQRCLERHGYKVTKPERQRKPKAVKLTKAEAEFVSDMRLEEPISPDRWTHFDPGFRQTDIARLIRRGWFERRYEGREREYRWTPEGIAALSSPAPTEEG